MARLLFLSLAVVLLAAISVSAVSVDVEDEAPVPEGFSLPNIFNPVLDRADGRKQAKTLVQLVAKEPKVAYGVGGPEKAIEDTWNGESDPESSASVAQKKMLREVDKLTKLIDQGKKILKILPRKEKRLALLKRKLSKILDAKAKREAHEKIDQQRALLNAIKKREGAMSTRLNALKKSQGRLESSVTRLQDVIDGKKKAKKSAKKLPKVGSSKVAAGSFNAGSTAHRFADSELDADAEAEIAAEAEVEAEAEASAETETETEEQ